MYSLTMSPPYDAIRELDAKGMLSSKLPKLQELVWQPSWCTWEARSPLPGKLLDCEVIESYRKHMVSQGLPIFTLIMHGERCLRFKLGDSEPQYNWVPWDSSNENWGTIL